MKRACGCCKQSFVISEDDQNFYHKVNVPEPSWCPACRELRRMSWCNEGVLYLRSCDLCSRRTVSQFAPHNPRKAYCMHCWWSDKWNPLDYGRDVDLNRSFLDQFNEFVLSIPHCHTHTDLSNDNSDYTHHAGNEKNCYMMFHCSFAEDCYYGYGVKKARSCVDNHYCHQSELCFECIDVQRCYDLAWCQDCTDCSTSRFLFDCIGCKNCFLCTGLRNVEYYFLNEKLTKEDYLQRVSEFNLGSSWVVAQLVKRLQELKDKHTHKNLQMTLTEDSVGNHLHQAREAVRCFDCSDIEYSKYCTQLQLGTRYCHDIYQFGIEIELCYDCSMIGYNIYNCQFCYDLLEQCRNLQYCLSCNSTKDSFGCYGLKSQQYCILNKQYSKEDYQALKAKIVERMIADGEYGSFFPVQMSPHGYNETTASYWYPKEAEEVRSHGWSWEDNLPFSQGQSTLDAAPDDIRDVTDAILQEVLCCETCARDFRITNQELAFYQRNSYPVPRECFQCRRARRMAVRDPREFWQRNCSDCGADIFTTIAPSRPSDVVCEECYFKRVY